MSRRADKRWRRQAILDILHRRAVSSQAELAEVLAGEGHRVTQSTLSRDLKDLRVLRVPGEDGYRYRPPEDPPTVTSTAGMRSIAAAEVLSVSANESLVVVRTQVGRASGVAAFLDSQRLDGVLATVAGDDTILVVPSRESRIQGLRSRLEELLGRA